MSDALHNRGQVVYIIAIRGGIISHEDGWLQKFSARCFSKRDFERDVEIISGIRNQKQVAEIISIYCFAGAVRYEHDVFMR